SVYVSRNEENNLVKRDVLKNNSEVVLLDNRTWNVEGASDFSVSPDEKYILLICHKVHEYGQSYSAIYKIYDVDEQKLLPTLKPENVTDEETRLRYASWSPTKSQASLIFVFEGNIYYMEDIKGSSRQITFDGKENLIYNGVPDVAFSDETLGSDHAIYWFGEGGRFVYAKFDDTDVETSWVSYYDHLANPKASYNMIVYFTLGGGSPLINSSLLIYYAPTSSSLQRPLLQVCGVDGSRQSFRDMVEQDSGLRCGLYLQCNSGTCRKSISEESKDGWVVVRNPLCFRKTEDRLLLYWSFQIRTLRTNTTTFVSLLQRMEKEVGKLTEGKYEVSKIVAYHAITMSSLFSKF
ncbi:putative inactive dipeptidyl peptidase 10, partial [Apostichopus japonicus]